ncbi:MAG TPA: hypothetical protein VFC18_21335 [Burkholderiales bacterium]|nr:hypothetical protein [Burkholderiales bacterium]
MKLHTLLDLRGGIPNFLYVSDRKISDLAILDPLIPEPGAYSISWTAASSTAGNCTAIRR